MEPDETGLLKSVENNELHPISDAMELKSRIKQAAKKMQIKDFRLNIRVSQTDIEAIKVKALQEGIPYQTLIASVLHKYAKGKFQEK